MEKINFSQIKIVGVVLPQKLIGMIYDMDKLRWNIRGSFLVETGALSLPGMEHSMH